MHGLYFLYISYQVGQLTVSEPFDKRRDAEDALLDDVASLTGYPVHEGCELDDTLSDAYSKTGLELTGNREGADDVTLYLRELEMNDPGFLPKF